MSEREGGFDRRHEQWNQPLKLANSHLESRYGYNLVTTWRLLMGDGEWKTDRRRYQASNRSSYDNGKLRRIFHDV